MKKYTKPSVQVVELSVKESLSALPGTFNFKGMGANKIAGSTYKNISIYNYTSAVQANS